MNRELARRKAITLEVRQDVWRKLRNRCHICAGRIRRNAKSGQPGRWHVDHVFPRSRGGRDDVGNYLPICKTCNRLKWDRSPRMIRKILGLGIIAFGETRRRSEVGKALRALYAARKELSNSKRRR